MRCYPAGELLRVVQPIAGEGIDRILHDGADNPVVAVKEGPGHMGVVGQHRLRTILPDEPNDLAPKLGSVGEPSVGQPQCDDIANSEDVCRGLLFAEPGLSDSLMLGVRTRRTRAAVGANHKRNRTAGVRPFGQSRSGADLGVVGMGANGHCSSWNRFEDSELWHRVSSRARLRAAEWHCTLDDFAATMTPLARIAVISYHTCPLEQPGAGDSGGMNVYVRETAAQAASAGLAVDIYTRQHGEASLGAVEMSPGVRLIHVPAGPPHAQKTSLRRWTDLFADRVLASAGAERIGYDGIISHYWLSGIVANRLSREWSAPHVTLFHTLALAMETSFPAFEATLERVNGECEVIEQAHSIVASSAHEREALTGLYGADARNISVVSPGVDQDCFYPRDRAECRRRLGLRDDRRYLLFVGRTIPMKGMETLIRAVARLPSEARASALVVGGEANDAAHKRLLQLAQSLGPSSQVHFAGCQPHDRLALYYGAADVCVIPSHYESFGMVAVEAQASGRPVVASRVGGLTSAVQHGVTGLTVRPGSAQELAAAIRVLLENSRLTSALSHAGIEAARRLTWRRTSDGVLTAAGASVTGGVWDALQTNS